MKITCTKDYTSQVSMKCFIYFITFANYWRMLAELRTEECMQNKQAKQTDTRVTLNVDFSNVSLALEITTTENHTMAMLKLKHLSTTEKIL